MKHCNAAGRLSEILESSLENGKNDQFIGQVLGHSLGFESWNTETYRFTSLFLLFDEAIKSVRQLKGIPRVQQYIDTLNEIQELFLQYSFFQFRWDQISGTIAQRNYVMILDSCSNLISQQRVDPYFPEDILLNYLHECEDLLNSVVISALPKDIQSFLIIRLEEVCSVLRNYHLGSSERLRMVVEANIGGMILRQENLSKSCNEFQIVGKVFGWLLTLGAILDLGANVENYLIPKLIDDSQFPQIQLIEPSNNPPEKNAFE